VLPDHREVWPNILPGLEALHAMHPEQDWDIAGVRKLLDNDLAVLLVDAADPAAFFIVRFDQSPYHDGEIELFIYLAWNQGGDAQARLHPHLEMFARMGGARHIRFYSRRQAFLRVAPRLGYELRGIEYAKELDDVIR